MADLHWYILFLVFLFSTIVIRTLFAKTRTKFHLPPSPFALPIIGHLHLLGPLPHRSFHKLSNRFGPLIHLYLGSVPCVVVSSPEMAKEFLKTQENSFLNRPHMAVVDYLSYPSGAFVFAKFGPYWKFMRKLCASQLLGGQTLNQLAPIRRDELKRFLNLILKKANQKEIFDVGGELGKMANNVISRMTIRKRCSEEDEEAEEIRRLVKETTELAGRFNLSDTIWFCKNLDLQGFGKICKGNHDRFDALMEKIINDREEARREGNGKGKGQSEEVKDVLDILLDICEDESSEIRLNKDHIKAFILDMFVAGTDTSAVTAEWVLAELINHPNIMNKAREEIDSVVGKTRLIEESDIPNLPYIQAIVKETFRLHPTGALILRESSQNCTVAGYYIPKKTWLSVNIWAIGRDLKHWEDPLEFKPERFLVEQGSGIKSQMDVRGHNFLLLPFGSGRRSCPGATLALQVVHTTIAAMIQCFEWKVDGTLDMEEAPGITLPMAHPLVCVPIPRLFPLPI